MEVMCMDIRTGIVQNITAALADMVDAAVVEIVADMLTIEFNNYEVQERCTAVAIRDDSAEGMLRKFIATKWVEGIADSTLRRYAEQNRALINFLGNRWER